MAAILLRAIVSGFGHKIGTEIAKTIVNRIDEVRNKKALRQREQEDETEEITSELPDDPDAAENSSPHGDDRCDARILH